MRYLTAEANPEFNNGGGFFLPIIDFGLAGALLYWVLAGVMCGILYRMFQQRRPAGLLLYPITFTSVIELSRIVYWAEGRVLLPMCVLTGIALACSYYNSHKPIGANIAAKEPQWQPSH
jgi:predicted membrane-bound mannosyltransferase